MSLPEHVAAASAANLAVILTPPGAAAIAVVRITGPGVAAFVAQHFSEPVRLGFAVHGMLTDGDRVIDDPVVVLLNAQAADVNLHGGPWLVQAVIELLGKEGFSASAAYDPVADVAIDAEADDLLWNEVLADLPRARTELAVRILLAQPAAWRAWSAAPRSDEAMQSMLSDRSIACLLGTPLVAIVGPANVGKSTLANQLFGRVRSITSDLPGTTRDWVGGLANINGVAVMLVDTPGLRDSDDEIEQTAIARSYAQVAAATVVIVVVDASRPLDGEQQASIDRHPGVLLVINKVDQPPVWNPAGLAHLRPIALVATCGTGLDDLSRAILSKLGCDDLTIAKPRCWTNRQRDVLLRELKRAD